MVPVMMKPTGKQFNFLSPNILIQILLTELHMSSVNKLREFDKRSKYFRFGSFDNFSCLSN